MVFGRSPRKAQAEANRGAEASASNQGRGGGGGGGGNIRRQNSSSSSLDRMVGEDLPAMLSHVFALGEQGPHRSQDRERAPRISQTSESSFSGSERGDDSQHQRVERTTTWPYDRDRDRTGKRSSASSNTSGSGQSTPTRDRYSPHNLRIPNQGVTSQVTIPRAPLSPASSMGKGVGLGSLAGPLRSNIAVHNAHAVLPSSFMSNGSEMPSPNQSFNSMRSSQGDLAGGAYRGSESGGLDAPSLGARIGKASSLQSPSLTASQSGFSLSQTLMRASSIQNLATFFRRPESSAKLASAPPLPTIAFFNLPWAGHAFPTYPLVSHLVARGVKVHYFQGGSHKSLIKRMGAEFHNYGSDDMQIPECFSRNRSLAKPLQLLPATAALLPYLLEKTRAINPSIIMFEASVTWGWAVARILDIPSVCVCSMSVGNTLESMNPLIYEALVHDEGSREANIAIKERYGVDIMAETEFYFHYSKHLNLVTTAEMINPPFARHKALKVRQDTFHFVGPMMDKRFRPCNVSYVERLALQTKLSLAQRDSKVIYVSFGTIVMDEYWTLCKTDVKGTLNALLEAVGGHQDTFVVIVTGSNKQVQKEVKATLCSFNGQPPPNFSLRSFVDQLKILESSADIFITHGGQNSLMEALYFERPCIIIPFFGDQPENAAQMELLGCGTHMRKDHWKNPHELMSVINQYRVETGPHTIALVKASKALRACGGASAGADKVLEMSELVDDFEGLFEMML